MATQKRLMSEQLEKMIGELAELKAHIENAVDDEKPLPSSSQALLFKTIRNMGGLYSWLPPEDEKKTITCPKCRHTWTD